MLVCLNGTFIPREDAKISILDGGFLFGDTLFETLKANGNKILLQDRHLDRLTLSAKLLDFPCDREKIATSLNQLGNALTHPNSRIRLTLSRGPFHGLQLPEQSTGYFLITASQLSITTDEQRDNGASCVIAPNQRVNPLDHLPQMKRGNYADCLYAANYAKQKNAREALFIDKDRTLLEGSTTNLFVLKENRLLTPPVGENILAGVMRRQVIDAATEMGILVVERNIGKDELFSAEEAFLTNSLIDILPIASIDGIPINRGQNWKSLLKILRVRIET